MRDLNHDMNPAIELNMDFDLAVQILGTDQAWLRSPADGVSRVHLERCAPEHGHTTSFVKFAAGASFSAHAHPAGEEIYVMEGVFSDENGDYPAGSYLRNPPGSKHTPFTRSGCTLFVKLNQFQADDLNSVAIKPADQHWQPGIGGLEVRLLHSHLGENTALVKWPENERFQPHNHWGGEEIVVLSGTFIDEHGRYPAGSWLRSPHMSQHFPYVEEQTTILVKTGHLQAQA